MSMLSGRTGGTRPRRRAATTRVLPGPMAGTRRSTGVLALAVPQTAPARGGYSHV